MSRSAVGWLLLLGSPGVAAGLALTAFAAVAGPVGSPASDVAIYSGSMALAGIGSAAGASRFTPDDMTDEAFALVSVGGFVPGAAACFLTISAFGAAWRALTL